MKKLHYLFAVVTLTVISASAQLQYPSGTTLFDGIHNFSTDSTLRDLVKQLHIKSISQIVSTATYTFSYGEFQYNEKAQLSRMRTQSANAAYAYNDKLRTKELHYGKNDSLESWTDYVYDDKNRLLKIIRNYYNQGKLMSYTETETKPISEDSVKRRWESIKYGFSDIYTITYALDSAANDMHYYIEYIYRPKDVDQKGRKSGDKKMTRMYTKNNCRYEDIVKYKVYGRLETPDDIKTYYFQGDEKGRLIEFGEIDYESAMMQYVSEHPEQFSYGSIPPGLIKAILNGQLKTTRRAKIKQVYDAKGRIIEKEHYGSRYTFKYNAKGQLVAQIKQGEHPTTDELFYNEKGLISRIVTTGHRTDSGDKSVVLEESIFSYTYY